DQVDHSTTTHPVSFDPLHLSFDQPGLTPELVEMLVSGAKFDQVDVLGYDSGATGTPLAVDYSFGLASVAKLNLDASGLAELDLRYPAQELRYHQQNPDGTSPSTPTGTAAWNQINKQHSFIDVGQGSPDPLPAPPKLPGDDAAPAFDSSSLHYYVRFKP